MKPPYLSDYPHLTKEIHPTKNGDINPSKIKRGTGRKLWWLCEKGHEWEATVAHRTRGQNCPFCLCRRVNLENCLLTVKPQLALEWHPTKNSITPDQITPGSDKKVWWLCERGHEWETTIGSRTSRNTRCPYCVGRYITLDNCLSTVKPELALEWHPTKNSITPDQITPGSDKKVWWLCSKKHEWEATVAHRTRGQNCPFCAGHRTNQENCLLTINPQLAQEWHPTKNSITPDQVPCGSSKKAWWICPKGHEWETAINIRQKCGCPFCCGKKISSDNCLSAVNPKLALEWHPTKNLLTVDQITCGSHKKVWWLCNKGHEWEAVINSRSGINSCGCPFCDRRKASPETCLLAINPKLASQWHPTKNTLTPEQVKPGSVHKVWWLCEKGHEWKTKVSSRSVKAICPYCVGRYVASDNCLSFINPELAKQWHPTKNSITPDQVPCGSHKKVWWICPKGHEWETMVGTRSRGSSCPFCKESKGEKDIENWLLEYNLTFRGQYSFDNCMYKRKLRFDFAVFYTNNDSIKLIEFQGRQHYDPVEYWGGQKTLNKIKKLDNIKKTFCEENNIPLLTVPYWEQSNLPNLLQTFIFL